VSRAGEAPAAPAQTSAAAEAVAVKGVKAATTRRPRAAVDTDRIIFLYTAGRMSLRQVAKEVGVSHVTVARRIVEKTGQLRAWRLPGET